MTSNGERGAQFERQTRDLLAAHGYTVVRSAASKSALDLVAIPTPERCEDAFFVQPHTLVIQAKIDGRLDTDEWNHLYQLARCGNVTPVLARREKVGRRHVVALYRLTGPRVPRSRTWPMERIVTSEEGDA